MLDINGYTVSDEDMQKLNLWLVDVEHTVRLNKYRVFFTNTYDYRAAMESIAKELGFKEAGDMPPPEPQKKDTTWQYNGCGAAVAIPYLLQVSHQHLKEIRVEPELLGKRSVARKRLEASGIGTHFILPVGISDEANRAV